DEQARRFGRQVRVVVVTNGTKITPTLIECFKKHDCHVNVSMDGDRETHNRQRPFGSGKPSYDALLDGIRQLSEGGIRFGVRMTAIRGESDLISGHQAMAATAAESVGICFNVYGEDATRPLRGTEYEQLLAFYRDIARRVLRGDPAAVKLATVQKQLLGITIGRRRSFNCGAGRWGWTVAPDGEAFPCHRFAGISAFSLGRVTDEGFRFRSHPMFEADAVENRLVCRDGRPGCAQCYARFLCGGGCAQIGFVNTGLISEMPTFYCKEQRLRVRAIVGALAEVLVVKHRRGEAGDQTDSDSDD
ncbi:MAG: SPASM domain-containing protein, partial [bacterium]|nr:SPASM domain-containing protein [bacterium]